MSTLETLLAPRTVAVIGASTDPAKIGGRPIASLIRSGFSGTIYPVNSRARAVQGLDAYGDIADLPEGIDVAIIAVPAADAVDAVTACAARGVGHAVVFTAGFAEASPDGACRQDEMVRAASAAGMRILGPNSLGLTDFRSRFVGSFHPAFEDLSEPGTIGFVSQSGAFAGYSIMAGRKRGLRFSACLTTGNEADIDVSEGIECFVADVETRVVVAYLEGCRDGPRLRRALAAAAKAGKVAIAVKVGRSEAGARAAASHTAAMAGSDRVFDAMLCETGAIRADSMDEMLDLAYAAALRGRPSGRRLGIVTLSGGMGIMMADAAVKADLVVPSLAAADAARIRHLVPFAGTENPIDVTAQASATPSLYASAAEIAARSGTFDLLASFIGTLGPSLDDDFLDVWSALPLPSVVVGAMPDRVRRRFEEMGCAVFEDPVRAVAALAKLSLGPDSAAPLSGGRDSSRTILADPPAQPLTEPEALATLCGAGISVVMGIVARSAGEAAKAAESLGYPVVAKMISRTVTHKSDAGGVRLGLRDVASVMNAYCDLSAIPGTEAIFVAPMVEEPGIELILGTNHDPVFGPVILVGVGGVFAEVFGDVALRLAPVTPATAAAMLKELRGYALLEGARGARPTDITHLAETISRLSAIAADSPNVDAIDLNPYLALPKGGLALDAVIILR